MQIISICARLWRQKNIRTKLGAEGEQIQKFLVKNWEAQQRQSESADIRIIALKQNKVFIHFYHTYYALQNLSKTKLKPFFIGLMFHENLTDYQTV